MKHKYLALFCCSALAGGAIIFSGSAYANDDQSGFNYNVVDSPPVRHIYEPTLHSSDTATGMNAERQVEIQNSNPTEVVNPE